jgi:hypothetical protein
VDITHPPAPPDAYQELLPPGVAAMARKNWEGLVHITRRASWLALAIGLNLTGWVAIWVARERRAPAFLELTTMVVGLLVAGLSVYGFRFARGVDPALTALRAPEVRVVWVLLRELPAVGKKGLPLISLRLGLSSGQRMSFIVDAQLAGGTAEAMRKAGETYLGEALEKFNPPLVGHSTANEQAFTANPKDPKAPEPAP